MRKHLHMLAALVGIALLACCASPAPVAIGCATVRPWTLQEQQQMKAETHTLPPDAIMNAVMADYISMRDQSRKCDTAAHAFIGP